jgi:plasmid stabilization system protein ParE
MAAVRFLETARRDLVRLTEFLLNSGVSRQRNDEIVNELVAHARVLANNPEVGFKIGGKFGFQTSYRGLVAGSYIMVYEVLGAVVEIRRIYFGREDYINELRCGNQ